jgi:hypothetical protein
MKKIAILVSITALLSAGVAMFLNSKQKPNKAILSNLKYKDYISVVYIQDGDTLGLDGISQSQYDSLKIALK